MSWADFELEVRSRMTVELAQRVRELRVRNEESWRGVAEGIFEFPESAVLSDWAEMKGHQPLGMYLCAAAAASLGENPDQEPWN